MLLVRQSVPTHLFVLSSIMDIDTGFASTLWNLHFVFIHFNRN